MRASDARKEHARCVLPPTVALIVAGALAACGASASRVAPPQARVFIDLVTSLPRNLDPAAAESLAFDRLETSLASTLVRPAGRPPSSPTLAPAAAVVSFLARSWKRLAGGDYILDLRRGVRSPYRHTLTATDVRFSFRRELAGSATARALARLAAIALADPVTVLTPTRVRLNVTRVSPLALAFLADFHFAVLDARAVRAHATTGDPRAQGWLTTHLAFYGAYELARFDPGRQLLLTATPHFRAPLAFHQLAIEAVRSATVRLADVGAGVASHTSELDWSSFQTATHTIGLTAQRVPATTVSRLVPDERFRPFASVLVRRALSLAIDRAAISRAAFAGLAKPARHPEPSTIVLPAGVAEPVYTHDVLLAKRLLARAGYPRGFSFGLAASAGDGGEIPAELAALTGELRVIGLRVWTRMAQSPADLARLGRLGRVAAVLDSSVATIASAPLDIATNYLRRSPGNVESYDSPALNALGTSLTATAPDSAANRTALQRALRIVGTTFPVIPLVEIPAQNITLARIGGYAAYATQATYYDRLKP